MPPKAVIKDKQQYIFKAFSDSDLICAFSSRQSGNMSLVYGDTGDSLKHRKEFLGGLGVDYRDLTCAKQVHGNQVAFVRQLDKGKGALLSATALADTDGLITNFTKIPLAIFTADCLSVFLFDRVNKAIGLVHAGWRSSRAEISVKAVQLMKKNFNTLPENICIGFGPGIRECCHEVGEEFKNFFDYGLTKRNNRYYLDLSEVNKRQFLELGVKAANIFDSGICTSCRNKDFFSFRKEEKRCGRMISVAMLR